MTRVSSVPSHWHGKSPFSANGGSFSPNDFGLLDPGSSPG
ncbi:hypothetical protein MNBD_ALPHA11-1222 [hydrothermal vent metagenome]|uniref:Uncharacterized protein n=1 Tax=hydrothermal vent metagenome TaxID=652676 RepID=A0A3B0TN46_9ZZZZ